MLPCRGMEAESKADELGKNGRQVCYRTRTMSLLSRKVQFRIVSMLRYAEKKRIKHIEIDSRKGNKYLVKAGMSLR